MWRLYLELTILVVLAFAVGAALALVVMRRLVKETEPADETDRPAPGTGAAEVTQ